MEQLTYHGQGERIDKWLTVQFPYARNFFHHIIARGGIQIVGNKEKGGVVKKSYKLKPGDVVQIDDLQRYLSPEILDEAPQIDLPIKLEKEDYVVLYKPKGVLSHPNSVRDVQQPSVVGFLYHMYKSLPTVGNFIRAGLLHRLDKETDGLMIIAKTEKGLAHFKQLFQQKSQADGIAAKEAIPLKKFYRATCEVTPQGKQFLSQIGDSLPYVIEEMVVPKVPHSVSKMGITKIMSISMLYTSTPEGLSGHSSAGGQCIDIILEILTGRTHQIRYHLSQKGLPIVGDYIYGRDSGADMVLTAYKLQFSDPNGEQQAIVIP